MLCVRVRPRVRGINIDFSCLAMLNTCLNVRIILFVTCTRTWPISRLRMSSQNLNAVEFIAHQRSLFLNFVQPHNTAQQEEAIYGTTAVSGEQSIGD